MQEHQADCRLAGHQHNQAIHRSHGLLHGGQGPLLPPPAPPAPPPGRPRPDLPPPRPPRRRPVRRGTEAPEYVDGILWLTVGDVAGSAGGEETAPERWETLAVGLRMAVDYLEGRTDELPRLGGDGEEDEGTGEFSPSFWTHEIVTSGNSARSHLLPSESSGLGTGGGGVYAEGPRIPATTPDGSASPPSAAIPAGEEAGSEAGEEAYKPPASSSPVFRLMSALPSAVGRHVEHPEPRVRSLVG
ncbi:hypothetical protein THAOC_03909, partial [Thalassiosira oceanica]